MKIKWTLLKKIQSLIIMILVIVYGISLLIMVQYVESITYNNYSVNTQITTKLVRENIEIFFADVSNSLNFINERIKSNILDEGSLREYLSIQNEMEDHIINTYIAFEDGSYYLEPDTELPSDFDPRNRTWYKMAYGVSGIQWSAPYVDVVTGEIVITGAMFIETQNQRGVLGMDIRIDKLLSIISSGKLTENSLILLIDSEGNIVADSQGAYTNEHIETLDDPAFSNSNIITGTIETEQGIYQLRRLNYSDIRLVAYMPFDDLDSSSNDLLIKMSFILFIALAIGLILGYFVTRQITNPIVRLTETMKASKELGNLLLYEGGGDDEITTLTDGYNSMAISFNEQGLQLKKLSDNLTKSEEKLQDQYDHASLLAFRDQLTKLPNRFMFEQTTESALKEEKNVALLFIDLDNFKHINDTYGHQIGDEVLKVISQRFKACYPEALSCARLSGDEYGILINSEVSPMAIETIAENLLEAAMEPILIRELELFVTASIGISLYPGDGGTYNELLANADIAMYDSKRKNKNGYSLFKLWMKDELFRRISIESRLLKSIENNELEVYFQPLLISGTEEVYGFEALARWLPEDLDPIYPDVFIPIAEENLYIIEIGQFVLQKSLEFQQELKREFGRYYEMNVNVSVVELNQESFVEKTLMVVNKTGIPRGFINFEMTESVALDKGTYITSKLGHLREEGFKISLDDFGTGYSSLNHLLNLSLTHVKIDRSIIKEVCNNDEVYFLVESLVLFAHSVNLKVVAEGIEDIGTEEIMVKIGVDYLQGYLYAKPASANEVIQIFDHEQHHR